KGNHLLLQTAFSPDGRYLAVVCQDGWVTVWNGTPWGVPLPEEPADEIAASVPEGKLKPRDVLGGKLRQAIDDSEQVIRTGRPGAYTVWSAAYHRDGRTLATVNGTGKVNIWDMPEGTLRQVLDAHEQPARCVAYSPDGSTLATASEDRTVKLWDA